MIRRALTRLGVAVVLTWTPRHKSWQVVRHRHSDSTLCGDVYDEIPRTRRQHRPPCPPAPALPGDRFLSDAPHGKCVDAAGYRRRAHEYVIWTRRGWRCLWCGRYQHEVGG